LESQLFVNKYIFVKERMAHMKLKRFTYLLGVILMVALSLSPSTAATANSKFPETFTVDWYEELGTCNDGSTIVDSEVLTYNRTYYLDDNEEILKIIDHISGDAMVYVKENPDLFLKADPFGSMSVWYFKPELKITDSGSTYKMTIPGMGNIFSGTGRSIWVCNDSGCFMTFSRGNWTPRAEIVDTLCTYFGLQ
jgi:hypothetical protein